jgi:hypothetical protein
MFHCSLWEVSVPCHKDVISTVLSGIQGDCKVIVKRMAQSKDRYKMETDAKLFLFLVILRAQVRSQYFSAKAT